MRNIVEALASLFPSPLRGGNEGKSEPLSPDRGGWM